MEMVKVFLETLKKSSQIFAIFLVPIFDDTGLTNHDFLWFLKQDFAEMVHLSENVFFSGIYKYLNGQVLCVQFFDFRFRLDFFIHPFMSLFH